MHTILQLLWRMIHHGGCVQSNAEALALVVLLPSVTYSAVSFCRGIYAQAASAGFETTVLRVRVASTIQESTFFEPPFS